MINFEYISAAILCFLSIYIVRLILILPFFKITTNSNSTKKVSVISSIQGKYEGNMQIFLFLGSGGHTGEMLRIVQNYKKVLLDGTNTLYVGYSDIDSYNKFKAMAEDYKCQVKYYEFVKARKVGAGLLSSIKSIIQTLVKSFQIIIIIRLAMINKPHLVLLNGPGTCCIIALYFKLLEWVSLVSSSSNIIYVESLARVDSLSLSGKILYWLADEFLVQWEELKESRVPRAKYFGILV